MLYKKIAGLDKVKDIVTRAFVSRHIPHAWLFIGEEGSQNREMAYELSKTLLCDQAENQYCDHCQSCNLFAAGSHPDFFALKPGGKLRQMKKEKIISLLRFFSFKSYRGGYKVSVIEDADRLSDISANTLLKSLEEPPPNSVFILTASKQSSLLPTIVSRCQQIDFLPLSYDEVRKWLENQQGLTLDIETLIRITDGKIGNLTEEKIELLLFNRKMAFSIILDWSNRGKIAIIEGVADIMKFLEKERKKYEKEMNQELKKLKDQSASIKKERESHLLANMDGLLKHHLDGILQVFTGFFRDIMILQENLSGQYIKNEDYLPLLNDVSKRLTKTGNKIVILDVMRRRLYGTVNQKLTLESLLLQVFST